MLKCYVPLSPSNSQLGCYAIISTWSIGNSAFLRDFRWSTDPRCSWSHIHQPERALRSRIHNRSVRVSFHYRGLHDPGGSSVPVQRFTRCCSLPSIRRHRCLGCRIQSKRGILGRSPTYFERSQRQVGALGIRAWVARLLRNIGLGPQAVFSTSQLAMFLIFGMVSLGREGKS